MDREYKVNYIFNESGLTLNELISTFIDWSLNDDRNNL